jgi:tRNA-splicing endonuclease subunit Sen2
MSQEPQNDEEDADDLARGEEIEEMVQEMEHLQLGTEEAWFLAAGLGVLKVYDPVTVSDEC